MITLRYFAAAAEAAGTEQETWEPAPGAQLSDLRAELVVRHGAGLARVLEAGSLLVDGTVRRDDGPLTGEVVDVLPPFAGG